MRAQFAGFHVAGRPRLPRGLPAGAADGASQKEPAICDGSQSGRKRQQGKLIRGSAMCRNSHNGEATLAALVCVRDTGCTCDGRSWPPQGLPALLAPANPLPRQAGFAI
jgi:hypothetical protein